MTPSERLPRLLAVLNVLLASIPRDTHDGGVSGCAVCEALRATEAVLRDRLAALVDAMIAVHVDRFEGYVFGCSMCDALRDAERELTLTV